jgi:hypothetical protein
VLNKQGEAFACMLKNALRTDLTEKRRNKKKEKETGKRDR